MPQGAKNWRFSYGLNTPGRALPRPRYSVTGTGHGKDGKARGLQGSPGTACSRRGDFSRQVRLRDSLGDKVLTTVA
jgi:hypothetical protein